MPAKRVQKVAKKESSAAGMYGVACPIIYGKKCPCFLTTKNYTYMTVVSRKEWKVEFKKKIKEKSGIKSKNSEWYPYREAENAWEARYGTEINLETGRMKWEDEIRKAPGLRKKM